MSVSTDGAAGTLGYLHGGVSALVAELLEEPGWRFVVNPASSPSTVRAIALEFSREIASFELDMAEAGISAIGQFPRSMSAQKIRGMLVDEAEDWNRGYVANHDLGSPSAFATAACFRMFAHKRLPFAYLGARYLFAELRPLGAAVVMRQPCTHSGLGAPLLARLIGDVLLQFPAAAQEVQFGFDALRHVYPLPGWRAAVRRAQVATP